MKPTVKESYFSLCMRCNWLLVLLMTIIASVGVLTLYSASKGSFQPWAIKHAIRYALCIPMMFFIAIIPLTFWLRFAYIIYGMSLILLILVALMGYTSMGATRWISLAGVRIQPSEMMKLSLALALARYFHCLNPSCIYRNSAIIIPFIMVLLPTLLIIKQPDLGTALILLFLGGGMFFIAGISIWKFVVVIISGVAAAPLLWSRLHLYQKKRIFTFLQPENDPLGAGYNLLQSKIAIGSGGFYGKGFLEGTQSQLSFLPEKQTDFIFTMFAEEWGFIGGMVVIFLYSLVLFISMRIGLKTQNHFGRILAAGITILLFFHFFVNIGMVMGLIPIVGVPLPLISHGGTIMVTLMIGVGLLQNIYLHREERLSRFSTRGVF